jgi:maleylacetoacetate isomerase/maleylpyruvate isomerase
MAIIEYLDETHAETPLLPADALGRAHVRALAQMVACEIHPLNNLRVLKYLVHQMGVSDEAKNGWYAHWVRSGLEAFERQLALLDAERKAAGWCPRRFAGVTRPRWRMLPGAADLQRPALQCES